jgi:hypothetical protein
MQSTLLVHTSLPQDGDIPSADRTLPAEVVASATDVRLLDVVSVDYDIRLVGPDGTPRELHIAVSFPDEARALLQELSWRQAQSIVDTVFHIGAAYAARSVAMRALGESGPTTDGRAASQSTALNMPIEYFRAGLEAIRSSPTPM